MLFQWLVSFRTGLFDSLQLSKKQIVPNIGLDACEGSSSLRVAARQCQHACERLIFSYPTFTKPSP
jgi:hypothetical protein